MSVPAWDSSLPMQDNHLTTRFFFATFCLSQWDTDFPMLFMKYMASWPFGFFYSRHSTRPHPILISLNLSYSNPTLPNIS